MDVQGSLNLKVAVVYQGVVLRGATIRHVAAPVCAVFLGVFISVGDTVVPGATARVFEEGFL